MEELLKETVIYDELDELSKKRLTLHKVHDGSYYLVITDMYMTQTVQLSQSTIINFLNATKQ